MKHNIWKELKQSDFFSHISSLGYLPRWCVLLLDLMTCSLGYWISIWIGTSLFHYHPTGMLLPVSAQYGILIAVQAGCFWLFHTYSGILRYSTFIDTLKVLTSVVVCSMTLLVVNLFWYVVNNDKLFMNTALILYVFVSFVLLFCIRVGVKTLYESIRRATMKGPKVPVMPKFSKSKNRPFWHGMYRTGFPACPYTLISISRPSDGLYHLSYLVSIIYLRII